MFTKTYYYTGNYYSKSSWSMSLTLLLGSTYGNFHRNYIYKLLGKGIGYGELITHSIQSDVSMWVHLCAQTLQFVIHKCDCSSRHQATLCLVEMMLHIVGAWTQYIWYVFISDSFINICLHVLMIRFKDEHYHRHTLWAMSTWMHWTPQICTQHIGKCLNSVISFRLCMVISVHAR